MAVTFKNEDQQHGSAETDGGATRRHARTCSSDGARIRRALRRVPAEIRPIVDELEEAGSGPRRLLDQLYAIADQIERGLR
jgi:hypothetical protein